MNAEGSMWTLNAITHVCCVSFSLVLSPPCCHHETINLTEIERNREYDAHVHTPLCYSWLNALTTHTSVSYFHLSTYINTYTLLYLHQWAALLTVRIWVFTHLHTAHRTYFITFAAAGEYVIMITEVFCSYLDSSSFLNRHKIITNYRSDEVLMASTRMRLMGAIVNES